MPECEYKKCKQVSERCIAEIYNGEKDGYGRLWGRKIYLCKRHAKKLCKQFGLELLEGEDE